MPLPIAAAVALFEAVPALLRIFGKEKPAAIVDKAVAVAKAVTGQDTPEKALEVIKADPNKMLEYQTAVEERALSWAKLYIEDTQSARQREVDMAKAGVRDGMTHTLVILAFFGLAISLAVVVGQTQMNEYVKGIMTLFIGRALGWVEQIYSYYFGTTRQSKQKDSTIENLSKE